MKYNFALNYYFGYLLTNVIYTTLSSLSKVYHSYAKWTEHNFISRNWPYDPLKFINDAESFLCISGKISSKIFTSERRICTIINYLENCTAQRWHRWRDQRDIMTAIYFLSFSYETSICWYSCNTLMPRQNGWHFADSISKYIFLNETI